MKISVLILVTDSVNELPICLNNIDFADEVIIVDGGSVDGTVQEAERILQLKSLQYKIIERKWDGDYAAQRCFGDDNATGDWLFWVDSDEAVSDYCAQNLKKYLMQQNKKIMSVRLKIMSLIFDEEHIAGGPGFLSIPRIYKREVCKWQKSDKGRDEKLNWDKKYSIDWNVVGLIHYAFLCEEKLRKKVKPSWRQLSVYELIRLAAFLSPARKRSGLTFEELIRVVPDNIKWKKNGLKLGG